MDEFLGEEITHVTKEEIEAAFILFKNKKDETKKTILDKFTEIKYYTNNDFAFLVSSLPLADLISGSDAPPKMIDYACGAGHFLNEYASQIRPLVQAFKQADTAPYYQAIVGIEKEYRLSKVAKVSAFMYGQDGIQIVYGDGLTAHNDKVKVENGAFSVLVANPPYSVKGFWTRFQTMSANLFRFTNMWIKPIPLIPLKLFH